MVFKVILNYFCPWILTLSMMLVVICNSQPPTEDKIWGFQKISKTSNEIVKTAREVVKQVFTVNSMHRRYIFISSKWWEAIDFSRAFLIRYCVQKVHEVLVKFLSNTLFLNKQVRKNNNKKVRTIYWEIFSEFFFSNFFRYIYKLYNLLYNMILCHTIFKHLSWNSHILYYSLSFFNC
jgi:hypothetical protein